MNGLFIFTAKELKEQVKTFKGVAIAAVLLIFGMTSPLMAKLTPEIIKMAGAGITIKMPAPTCLDAYAQFFKNVGEMCIIVVLIIYAGSVVQETTRGTATLMLTKRLSRTTFIFAKFLSAAVVWTVSYASSAALCFIYTIYLFPKGSPSHLMLSLFCMWLFGIVTIAAAIFASSAFKSYATAAISGFAIWGLILLSAALPKVEKYSPAFLTSDNLKLISGSLKPGAAVIPIITACALTAVLLAGACFIFKKREL